MPPSCHPSAALAPLPLAPPSPDTSRRSSLNSASPSAPRPALPRSSSYLTKHRRTSSATAVPPATAGRVGDGPTPDITPPGTSYNSQGITSIRQSPPPVSDTQVMPPGAIVSPPESSSEDEGVELDARGRQIENIEKLKEAISAIPQHRSVSPTRPSPSDLLLLHAQVNNTTDESRQSKLAADLPALNTGGRKISHSRSHTDSQIYISRSAEASLTTSEEGSEQDEPTKKPPMVRKKSGELVRPALRPSSHRRPSSMPGTPTFSKAVHFDSHLEHVRHFLQVDRPLAVSAGSSPVDNYESDNEYPFGVDTKVTPRLPPFEWKIVVSNFPTECPIRRALPVRLERVWMSPDQKSLIGSVVVANLAFQKSVVCRFTFDYWKTVSEVTAEYHHQIRSRENENHHDLFQFSVMLSDIANLEAKTLFFCIRYNVNGLEFWDNNQSGNFQIDFRKKMLPQNGKKGFQGASSRPANGLPRSARRANPSTAPRPKSMPVGALDEFGHDSRLVDFDQPIHEFLGEPESVGLRLKSSKSTSSLPSDNLSNRLSAPSGQAFANRYDFGASLNAAKLALKDRQSNGLDMKHHKKISFEPGPATEAFSAETTSPRSSPPSTPPSGSQVSTSSTVPGTGPPSSATIASSSYEEILNKYCFFNGSKQTSPQNKDGTLRSGRYDGVDDSLTHGTNSTDSSSNGSPNTSDRPHHGAIHHTLRQNMNQFFYNGYLSPVDPSPAELSLQSSSSVSQCSLGSSGSSTPTGRSTSPGTMAGLVPFAGTSSIVSPADFAPPHVKHFQDRFPFASNTYAAAAIRG
ncbi:carbohydrate-binding module family 21 protein [Xylariaceae sp. FL0662B]|nr:carbohydrate-binding module family 21 protein [Xylariaceae sp. FL0662B]